MDAIHYQWIRFKEFCSMDTIQRALMESNGFKPTAAHVCRQHIVFADGRSPRGLRSLTLASVYARRSHCELTANRPTEERAWVTVCMPCSKLSLSLSVWAMAELRMERLINSFLCKRTLLSGGALLPHLAGSNCSLVGSSTALLQLVDESFRLFSTLSDCSCWLLLSAALVVCSCRLPLSTLVDCSLANSLVDY